MAVAINSHDAYARRRWQNTNFLGTIKTVLNGKMRFSQIAPKQLATLQSDDIPKVSGHPALFTGKTPNGFGSTVTELGGETAILDLSFFLWGFFMSSEILRSAIPFYFSHL